MLRRSHDPADAPRRLVIPAGSTVVAGARVDVAPFLIDRHPVTCARYARFIVEANGPRPNGWTSDEPPPGRENWPVVGIDPPTAARFARWAGGRLPSEPEWQLAACGFGQGRVYPWGDQPCDERGPTSWRHRLAERDEIAGEDVGQRAPFGDSVFGVADLGAVWEMTSTQAVNGMIVRGGPWRDRCVPPRLSNQSFEWQAASDVGMRLAYPVGPRPWRRHYADPPLEPVLPPAEGRSLAPWDWGDAHQVPQPRTAAGRWRRELIDSRDGLRAYVHQNLAAAMGVLSFRELGARELAAAARVAPERPLRHCPPEERSFGLSLTVFPTEDAPGKDRLSNNAHGYDLSVDRQRVDIRHSHHTAGVAGGHLGWFSTTRTSCPMFVFTVTRFDLAHFVSYVLGRFTENGSCPT